MVSSKLQRPHPLTSIVSFFKTDTGTFLAIALLWQLVFSVIGFSLSPQQGFLGHMIHWDAGWYQHIISVAYGTEGNPAAPAFYPLFPLLVGFITTISFSIIPPVAAALLINTVALWFILLALWRILGTFKITKNNKILGIATFLAFPSAFFLHVFYSEAVFIAIAFWSYLFALKRKWWAVGILLALLTATRLPSLLFVGLAGLEYLRAYKWDIKKAFNKNILWFLLAPVGFLFYGTYLYVKRGDFLAMFHAYSATNDWTYQVFNPNILATLLDSATHVVTTSPNYELFINHILPLSAIFLIALSAVYILIRLKRDGIPLFMFSVVSIVLFTLNSNIVSVHRYALACIPLFIAAALLAQQNKVLRIVLWIALAVSLAIQLFIYNKFISNVFAG